jgi:hypothetical protein
MVLVVFHSACDLLHHGWMVNHGCGSIHLVAFSKWKQCLQCGHKCDVLCLQKGGTLGCFVMHVVSSLKNKAFIPCANLVDG